MKLYEYEGKQLFQRYGIPIPSGWLWNEQKPDLIEGDWIAKAQVLTGGRGKAGGILPVSADEVEKTAQQLMNMSIKGEAVQGVYLERPVSYQRELYLSILVSRNEKNPVLIASNQGGVDIESVPKNELLQFPIHYLLGLQPYMIRQVSLFFQLSYDRIEYLLTQLWNLFVQEEAELVEINPLFITDEGKLCAGDAKVIVQNESFPIDLPRDPNSFEARCEKIGAVGVELDGDIAIVTSGAGLGMATLDWVVHNQGSVRAMVDLGGHVIHDVDRAKQLMRELKSLQPKAMLFSFYFQVASCEVLGQAIAEELGGLSLPIGVRMKGKEEEKAWAHLSSQTNIYVSDQFEKALSHIVDQMKGVS